MLGDKIVKIRFWIFQVLFLLVFPLIVFLGSLSVIFSNFFTTRKSVKGEVALITGSANGLGKEIAIGLAKEGCHIAIADIDQEAAESTSKEIIDIYKVKSKAFLVDVTKYENIVKLAKDVEEQLGPVTILVNNAGMITFKKLLKPTPEEIQAMVNTNLTSHIYTVRIFLDKMRELEKGHIVAISSIAGVIPCHRQLEYTATKFGVRGLMKAVRTELFALNCEFIKTTTILPYFLKTNARVKDLVDQLGVSQMYPTISGKEAAEKIIEGIVTNKIEVVIPSIAALDYRLLELLPTAWLTKIVNNMISYETLHLIDES